MARSSQRLATFGDRVRWLRTQVEGLSQRELDALAGLHQGHVWQIEEGHRGNPKWDTVSGLKRVFGVSAEWLVEGSGVQPVADEVRASVASARRAAA